MSNGAHRLTQEKLDRFSREAEAAKRLRAILAAEGFIGRRVSEAMGFTHYSVFDRFLRDQITAGPAALSRVEQWLAKWDAGDVDFEPLRVRAGAAVPLIPGTEPPLARFMDLRNELRALLKSRKPGTLTPRVWVECGFDSLRSFNSWYQGVSKITEERAGVLRAWVSKEVLNTSVPRKAPARKAKRTEPIHGPRPSKRRPRYPEPADSDALRDRILALAEAHPARQVHDQAWSMCGFVDSAAYRRWLRRGTPITEHHAYFLREWLAEQEG